MDPSQALEPGGQGKRGRRHRLLAGVGAPRGGDGAVGLAEPDELHAVVELRQTPIPRLRGAGSASPARPPRGRRRRGTRTAGRSAIRGVLEDYRPLNSRRRRR